MANVIGFLYPRWGESGGEKVPYTGRVKTYDKDLLERKGPLGYEGYAHFMYISSQSYSLTVPHLDKFKLIKDIYPNAKADINLILVGKTETYNIPNYNSDTIASLKQYFLEHKTRDGIQYLLLADKINNPEHFDAFIPGLIHSQSEVLGYVSTYRASNNEATIMFPFGKSIGCEIISGASGYTPITNGVKISNITPGGTAEIKLTGSESAATVSIFNKEPSGTISTIVKIVNDYGDYVIASQLTDNKIGSVLHALSDMEEKTINGITKYYPVMFISLLNYSPAESVKNISPNFYKVPAAFVEETFMADVIGLSYDSMEKN